MDNTNEYEDWEDRLDAAEQVEREAADMMKIKILVAVNGHVKDDTLTVEQDHPFYGGLVGQGLAKVIG